MASAIVVIGGARINVSTSGAADRRPIDQATPQDGTGVSAVIRASSANPQKLSVTAVVSSCPACFLSLGVIGIMAASDSPSADQYNDVPLQVNPLSLVKAYEEAVDSRFDAQRLAAAVRAVSFTHFAWPLLCRLRAGGLGRASHGVTSRLRSFPIPVELKDAIALACFTIDLGAGGTIQVRSGSQGASAYEANAKALTAQPGLDRIRSLQARGGVSTVGDAVSAEESVFTGQDALFLTRLLLNGLKNAKQNSDFIPDVIDVPLVSDGVSLVIYGITGVSAKAVTAALVAGFLVFSNNWADGEDDFVDKRFQYSWREWSNRGHFDSESDFEIAMTLTAIGAGATLASTADFVATGMAACRAFIPKSDVLVADCSELDDAAKKEGSVALSFFRAPMPPMEQADWDQIDMTSISTFQRHSLKLEEAIPEVIVLAQTDYIDAGSATVLALSQIWDFGKL